VATVTVDGGFTYIGYNVENVGNVDCLNSSTGVKIWNYTAGHGHEVTRIVVSDDVIYAITADVLTKPIHIPGSIIYALGSTAVSQTLPLPVIAATMGIVILAVVFLVCWVRLKGKGSPPAMATT
jgi:outer membrane protein assembly factor BamB